MDKRQPKFNNKIEMLACIIEQRHDSMVTRTNKISRLDIGSVQRKVPKKRAKLSAHKLSLIQHEKGRAGLSKRPVAKPARVFAFDSSKLKTLTPFTTAAVLVAVIFYSTGLLTSAQNSQSQILGVATSAYDNLNSAQANLGEQNFESAAQLFNSAQSNLIQAQTELNKYKPFIWLNGKARSADSILKGASLLAESGKKMTQALQIFDELKVSSQGVETANFNDKLRQNRDLLQESLNILNQANKEFLGARSLPVEYSETLVQALDQVEQLTGVLQRLVELQDLYLSLFGDMPKTYVLVFQNYDELRATGGFIGTYGTLQVHQGEIKKLKIESIYNLDGGIYEQIAAPGPMQPEIKKWGTRDANWFADFPTSASKVLDFYELGRGTADGLIAFTPKLFEDILKIVGPVAMPEYGVTLTPENFQELVQFKTSVDYDKTLNQPKKFIDDLAPVLLNRLMDLEREQWFVLFQSFQTNLEQKHVLLYSKDPATQQKIKALGFDGAIIQTDKDYLSIINSNLGGTKTDLEMRQAAEVESKILSDGSIINTLKITRTNTASEHNRNYMRVLVPLGSQLISAVGMDAGSHLPSQAENHRTDDKLNAWDKGRVVENFVYERTESGKTEYAFWVNTEPNETQTVTLVYTLPFKISIAGFNQTDTYSFTYQKQPGVKDATLVVSLSLGGFRAEWISEGVLRDGGKLKFNSNSLRDGYWGAVLDK